MPRIPEIGYSTQPVGPRQQPQASAAALAAPGRGMQQLGGTVQAVGGMEKDYQEKQASFEAELQYLENEKQVRDTFEQAKRDAPEGAEGFTQEVTQRFDDWVPQAMDQAPTSTAAQQKLQLKYASLRNTITAEAQHFEAASRAQRDTRRMAVVQDGLANEARTNPWDYEATLKKADALIDGTPFWNDQQKGKVRTQIRQQIFNSSLDGWVTGYETNPTPPEDIDAAIKALKSGYRGYKNEADSAVYDQALTRLENRRKAVEQESRVTLGKDLADTLAAIKVNGPAADDGSINAERLAKVYPDDPKLQARVLDQINTAKREYGILQNAILTSPAEDAKTLADAKAGVKGLGAQYKAANLGELQRVLQSKWSAYNTDKVSYLLQADPSLAKDMKDAEQSSDPEDFKLVLDRLDAHQARMGTPSWNREYLGKGAAQQIAQQLTGVTAEDAANTMEQLQTKYQDKWPQVMRELEKQHIDPRYMVLGRLDSPADVSLRKELAAAFQAGPKKLVETIGKMNANDIDDKVVKAMQVFRATMVNGGRTGQEIISRETSAAQTLAYSLYQRGGLTAQEAATKAFNMLLGNRYDFGSSYRTPKGEIGLVEQAAGITLNNLKPEQFAPAAPGYGADPVITNSEAGINHRRQAAYTAAVKMGKWFNTPMGDGIMLFKQDDKSGYWYSPVKLENGKNVVLKFDDIRKNPPKTLEQVGEDYGIGVVY